MERVVINLSRVLEVEVGDDSPSSLPSGFPHGINEFYVVPARELLVYHRHGTPQKWRMRSIIATVRSVIADRSCERFVEVEKLDEIVGLL